tara:strand:- start:307 stop:1044 length:738 start_codon:yes stop_codon:yes gene_type:complete
MARKKAPPSRAPEYETSKKGNARKGKPVGSRLAFDATKQEAKKKKGFAKRTGGAPGQGKKKSPPGKAKDGSKCFTRTNKSGAAYVTCEGKQKSDKKLAKEISSLGKTSDKLQARKKAAPKAKASKAKAKPKISKAEFTNARANLTKTLARKPGTKPKPARSIGSYADSDATRRSTRPLGEGGFATRTGGAPGRFTSNPTGNKPKGMSMDEWRTRPSYREPTGYSQGVGQSEAGAIQDFLGISEII